MVRLCRQSVRSLVRTPGFTAVCVLTLALGIGATTAVFSVFYGVTMRPVPYANAARIVRVVQVIPPSRMSPVAAAPRGERNEPARGGISPDQLRDWRSRTLAGIALFSPSAVTLTGSNDPVRLNGARVSPALFSILGVRPLMGRTFARGEERPGSEPTVILGYRTWVEQFGSDPGILSRGINLNGALHRVVGVMAEDFIFPERGPAAPSGNSTGRLEGGPDYWLPFLLREPVGQKSDGFSLIPTIALVREGVSHEQATAEANSTIPMLPNNLRYNVELVNLREETGRQIEPTLMAFQLGVLFVLLIAGINVTNLLLARAARRRRELAIRVALGAGDLQIAREVIAEAVLLSLAGGALGWFIADAAISALKALPSGTIPRLHEVRLDASVLTFGVALSLVAGTLIGLMVTIRVLRSRPWAWLRQTAGTPSHVMPAFSPGRPSSVLVVGSIATAVVLLTGAGLLLNSFVRLIRVDPGFDPQRLLTFQLALPSASRYADPAHVQMFFRQLAESLEELPGVEAMTVATNLPFQNSAIGISLTIQGERVPNGEASFRVVMPGYFRTLRIPVVRGREFRDEDRQGQPEVVVVNETFARRYFSGGDAVGQEIQFRNPGVLTIVGVVGDTKASRLDTGSRPEVYYPSAQLSGTGVFLSVAGMVRTRGDTMELLPAVRSAVRELDPSLAVYNAASMDQLVADSFALSRLYTTTATGFGAVALLLAVIGLYGILAYSVSNRTHELGIQIALGADSHRIKWNVLREGLVMTSIGLVAGLAGAAAISRFLEALLFGVEPQDPMTFVAVALVFLLVASVASYLPARRATGVDPIGALRTE